MNISGRAKIAGVVGWPVSHSLSPRLHGFWLREYGVDGAYVPLAVAFPTLSSDQFIPIDVLNAAFVVVGVTPLGSKSGSDTMNVCTYAFPGPPFGSTPL